MNIKTFAPALFALSSLGLVACGGSDDAPSFKTIELNIAHINDHHSQLEPFANVELACADGGRITLATTADGKVTFFPEVDQLGRDVAFGVEVALGAISTKLVGG